MSVDAALLDRVRKLLALSTSSNVHEAAAAARRAQALITAHRLEQWLDAEAALADEEPIENAVDEPLSSARRIRRWRAALASALAQANGCVAYTRSAGRQEMLVLIGRARDRAVVHAMYDMLEQQLSWLSADGPPGRSKRWHDDFRIGAVDAIAHRLRAAAESARAVLDTTALTQLDPAEIAHREALDRVVRETLSRGRGRRITVDGEAYAAGRVAAWTVDLDGSDAD